MSKCRLSTLPGGECPMFEDNYCNNTGLAVNYFSDSELERCPCPSKMKSPTPSLRLSEALVDGVKSLCDTEWTTEQMLSQIRAVLARYGVEDRAQGGA